MIEVLGQISEEWELINLMHFLKTELNISKSFTTKAMHIENEISTDNKDRNPYG